MFEEQEEGFCGLVGQGRVGPDAAGQVGGTLG